MKYFKKKNSEIVVDKQDQLNKDLYQNYLKNHGKPVTRRDFLASGLIAGTATLTLPPILGMLANAGVAEAAECASKATSDLSALVVINCGGGIGLSGNAVFLDEGRQLLPSYSRIGLGSAASLVVTSPFGSSGQKFAAVSQIQAGILTTSTQITRDNTAALGVAVRSQDDSTNNKFDPTGMAVKAGLAGDFLPPLGSNRNQPALLAGPAPLPVNNYMDLVNAVGVQGAISEMSGSQKAKLFQLIQNMSSSQAAAITNQTGGQVLGTLVEEATGLNSELITTGAQGMDPRDDIGVATVWGIANGADGDDAVVNASMVYNALKGNGAIATLEIGGCDYHGNGRANTDAKDLEVGTLIGQVLETAAVMGKPVSVMVFSDGAVGSVDSQIAGSEFTSDRGEGGSAMMFSYDPTKRPEQRDSQIGQFTVGQAADDRYLTGDSPELTVAAMIANHLSVNGKSNLIDAATSKTFSASQLDDVLKMYKS